MLRLKRGQRREREAGKGGRTAFTGIKPLGKKIKHIQSVNLKIP